MYYQNVNQGYQGQGTFIPPSGYNINSNYQAYGPNIMMPTPYNQNINQNYNQEEDIYQRLDKIDRQIKNLDTRLQKIETLNSSTTDDIYII